MISSAWAMPHFVQHFNLLENVVFNPLWPTEEKFAQLFIFHTVHEGETGYHNDVLLVDRTCQALTNVEWPGARSTQSPQHHFPLGVERVLVRTGQIRREVRWLDEALSLFTDLY